MLIFLYGQDIYRSKEELRRMIEKNREADSDWFDFIRIDASDKQVEIFKELKQTTDTISMFSQKKLIIIEDVFSLNRESQDEILEFLKKKKIEDDKDITIIFWTSEADVKNNLFKYLKSKAEAGEFKPLQGAQLKKWIKDFIDKQKGLIDNSAVDKLIERVGNDLWRMSNELNKLFSHNKTIHLENVELLVRPEIDLNIFQLIDAIGHKQKTKVLSLFGQYIKSEESEYYLLSMIAYQIRNLIKVKTTKAIELLGLHPFVARKSSQQSENFTFEELKKIYHQLMIIDFESKLGKTDITTALELFLTNL
ncbi:MAG TPA: DNA polymerase III subunit delta [Candidatus Paceibacterota bacterium]|nr:DNA polymerase III subunit delta [Candidatus Paceibacterota bacterium]